MNLHWIDWVIVGGLFVFICGVAITTNRYIKSVAGFLAANRCAGRYVLSIADGIAALGAITIIGSWQMFYENGFTGGWWSMMMIPVFMIITVTGYITYRYRQTRAMTMAQFFEIRYSKKFRVFTGLLAFVAGTLNFAIFPAVGANFFIYFCGLPEAFVIAGVTLETFPAVMAILLLTSLAFTWVGGQIAVIVTDFFQGIFCNIVFLIALIVVFLVIDWGQIGEAFAMAPVGKSMVHPFKGGQIENFNIWYYIIGAAGAFYSYMSWQGSQGYNCSAKTPHEAKMAKVIGSWRGFAQSILLFLLPIVAYTLMTHPDFTDFATSVNKILGNIDNEQVRSQMTVPIILARFLPIGVRGALAAVMLAAFISTHDTYLHSWGSIFIQDVIMPLRKKPLAVKQHLWLLRFSILGVALFIYCFSLFFIQVDAILMYFALTATIFVGGSGAAIIGGLYWKRGTTLGAWGAMITGVTIAITGFSLQQFWPTWFDGDKFPINGQWLWAVAMGVSSFVYIALSLFEGDIFDLDHMLHRGKHAIKEDIVDVDKSGKNINIIFQRLGLTKEFTFADKVIFWATIGWSVLLVVVFIIGTVYNMIKEVPDDTWLEYWEIYSWIMFILGIVTTIWLTIGGLMNVKQMFRDLSSAKRDEQDDGMVVNHHNRNE